MELVGYVARTLSSQKNPYAVTYFVIQYFFIVVAPVMFSVSSCPFSLPGVPLRKTIGLTPTPQASTYTLISISINRIGRAYAPLLPPKGILWLFITCDVIATVIQVTGAALIGSAYSNGRDPTTPNHILLAGLAFQVFTFLLFLLLFAAFVYRSRTVTSRAFKHFAAATAIAALAVYLRTIFRLAETAEGLMRNLSTHEAYFAGLEFVPIVVAVYVFVVWHPGKWLGSSNGQRGKAFAGVVSSGEEGEAQKA